MVVEIIDNEIRRSTCLFCSLGCGLAFRSKDDRINAVDYDRENPVNGGSLCPRGYYNYELLLHPERLTRPQIGARFTSWAHSLSHVKKELAKVRPESVGIMVSLNSTNEDAFMAAKMANTLGTKHICAAGEISDIDAFRGYNWDVPAIHRADVEKLGGFECLLIIGDLLTRSPVLSKRLNQVKYGKRGNQIIVIDPSITHTSWFATMHLRNRPGTEAALMAGILKVIAEVNKRESADVDLEQVSHTTGIPSAQIVKAAKAFDEAGSGCIVFVPGRNKQSNDMIQYFVNTASGYSLNKKHITLFSYGNTIGVNTILDSEVPNHDASGDLLKAVESGDIRTLFLFGENMHVPKLEMVVRTALFNDDRVGENTVLLPLASHMERKGNVTLAGLRSVSLTPIAHNVGGRSLWKIISSIMDMDMGFDSVLHETWKIMVKGAPRHKINFKQMIKDSLALSPLPGAETENITHFGDNGLVKRFFWYRVNNKP